MESYSFRSPGVVGFWWHELPPKRASPAALSARNRCLLHPRGGPSRLPGRAPPPTLYGLPVGPLAPGARGPQARKRKQHLRRPFHLSRGAEPGRPRSRRWVRPMPFGAAVCSTPFRWHGIFAAAAACQTPANLPRRIESGQPVSIPRPGRGALTRNLSFSRYADPICAAPDRGAPPPPAVSSMALQGRMPPSKLGDGGRGSAPESVATLAFPPRDVRGWGLVNDRVLSPCVHWLCQRYSPRR